MTAKEVREAIADGEFTIDELETIKTQASRWIRFRLQKKYRGKRVRLTCAGDRYDGMEGPVVKIGDTRVQVRTPVGIVNAYDRHLEVI